MCVCESGERMSGVGIFILCSLLPNITQLFIALFINNMCSL